MITSQWRLSFLGACVLLLAFVIPYLFPQWDVYTAQFLRTHLLFIGALLLTLLFLLLWKYPKQQVAAVRDRKDRIDLEAKSRQTLAQIVGGAVLLGGLYFTAQTLRISQETLQVNQETLRTTQQGQITDRFTKAIDQLGNGKSLAVRLGGIYALERIAKDSKYDYWAVMEVLTAFVRERMQVKDALGEEGQTLITSKPPTDIQAVLTVLGRREEAHRREESQPLDLHSAAVPGADLVGANLERANLERANLERANLKGAQLQEANLIEANLTRARLLGANLSRANLLGANLRGARLQGAHIKNAYLGGARLEDVSGATTDQIVTFDGPTPVVFSMELHLEGAKLSQANLERANLRGAHFEDADFEGAHLEDADFEGAHLERSNMRFTNIKRIRFIGTNLEQVKNLTQGQINTACIDKDTKLPAGLTRPAPCHTP